MTAEDLSLDRVTVGITIESATLTPEQISERVGISWDEVHRIGDPRGHMGKKWERNVWRIFERQQGAAKTSAHELIPQCVGNLTKRLIPISGSLREISAAEDGEFFIHVTAQSVPGLNLSADILRILADTDLSLDVDIILYGDEADKA